MTAIFAAFDKHLHITDNVNVFVGDTLTASDAATYQVTTESAKDGVTCMFVTIVVVPSPHGCCGS